MDDDIAEISAVKRALQNAGLQPTLATNSTDALGAIEGAAPDVVVLAPSCENGDGAALARDIAARDATRHIPLVLLGGGDVEGVSAAVVPRPIDSAVLQRAVEDALGRSASSAVTPRQPSQPRDPPPAAPAGQPAWSRSLPAGADTSGPSVHPEERGEGSRYESEVAALERAAAEQDAIRELRIAGGTGLRDVAQEQLETAPAGAEAGQDARPQASEIRQRLLALARERAVSSTRLQATEPERPLPSDVMEGSLAAVPMPRWLAMAAGARASGRLEVACRPPRRLWLELGGLVGADSAAPDERAEEMALRLGLVTRDQHRELLPRVSGQASRRVGALLLERGCLKPSELALLARRRAEDIAFALFTSDARYRFDPAERVPPDERVALERGALALAVEGVRRRWGARHLDAVLGGPASLLAPAAHPPDLADLALSAEERRVAQLADGLRTLDEILAGTPLDALSSRQVLAALVEVGALEVKARGPLEADVTARAGAIDVLRVREKLEQVRRADYFAILGLGRGCTAYEVREAAERLLTELVLERFEAGAPRVAADVREIRRVVEDARDVLADDAVRAEYLASLED